MFKKLKSLLLTDQWFYGALVLLVGVISFTLGRASVTVNEVIGPTVAVGAASSSKHNVVSNEQLLPTQDKALSLTEAAAVVASKSGTKYHLPTCPGAKQIKEENKIYFVTIAEAEAAGYKRAANCP